MKRPKFTPEMLMGPGPLPISPDVAKLLYFIASEVDCAYKVYPSFNEFCGDLQVQLKELRNRAKRADELESALRTIKDL